MLGSKDILLLALMLCCVILFLIKVSGDVGVAREHTKQICIQNPKNCQFIRNSNGE